MHLKHGKGKKDKTRERELVLLNFIHNREQPRRWNKQKKKKKETKEEGEIDEDDVVKDKKN